MKIYFYRYGSICEPDVIDSFKRLGLDVDEETIEISKKNLLPNECVSIVSPKLMNNNYTFVFTINFFPWLSDVCQIVNVVYISLIVDSPVLELYSNSLSNSVNRIFLFDKMLFNEFEPYNKGHVFHIPLKTHDITNHILSMGYDLKSIADLICRLKFLIWRIEFDDGACNVNELLEYIKYNRLSDVAVEEIINQSSFHKEKIYKRIAAYGE